MKGKIFCMILLAAVMLTACGRKDNASELQGGLTEILDTVYSNAEGSQDWKEALEFYQTTEITEDTEEYLIGTTEIEYEEGICSAPMMSSVAYQCILLRLEEGEDVEAAKKTIERHADPIKWVCVEAESVVVENVGNVVLFVMADKETADAVKSSFLALGK